jgi:hypothetical protein
MKFACMSCAAKYSFPDGRLAAAGPGGLRVRCTRCRAIMVIASDVEQDFHGEDTGEALGMRRLSRGPAETLGGFTPAPTHAPVGELEGGGAMAAPAALSASGVFRPVAGVHREVTGLFFPALEGKAPSSRVWYAAIDHRPRGPFSAAEMLSLAERGKIRDATRVWRAGFASWTKVRAGSKDLSWLRKVVLARKLREMDAQERARARLGIAPVQLVRTSAGKNHPSLAFAPHAVGVTGMPPALPDDAVDDLPPLSLHPSTFLPDAWRIDDLPALPHKPRRIGRRLRASALAVPLALALASLGLAAVEPELLRRLASFVALSP